MSDDKRQSDHEIEVISRMARESSRFFSDLARALSRQQTKSLRTSYRPQRWMRPTARRAVGWAEQLSRLELRFPPLGLLGESEVAGPHGLAAFEPRVGREPGAGSSIPTGRLIACR